MTRPTKAKNRPEYYQRKQELCRTINEEYILGITNFLPKACHLIYMYYKEPFPVKIWQIMRLDQAYQIG